MAVRTRRCTGCPTRRNISRTSWVLPSPTTTFHHEFVPPLVVLRNATSWGTTRWSSMYVPRANCAAAASEGTPRTLARYSRSTP